MEVQLLQRREKGRLRPVPSHPVPPRPRAPAIAAVAEEERQTAVSCSQARRQQHRRGGCPAGPTAAYALVLWKMAHLAIPATVPDYDSRVLASLASG